ncbi:hypothetical protein J3R82DRAFT_7869, partial [Butyriboletus roseoflavus]
LENSLISPVSASVLDGLGLLTTAWRIYFRLRIRRFWWEDAWAVILFFTGSLWVTAQWTLLLTNGLTSIVSSWIYTIGFMCVVTSVSVSAAPYSFSPYVFRFARMSILFSIIRIIHEGTCLKFTHACVAFFAVCWVILIAERVWQCASNPSWHQQAVSSGGTYCNATSQMSIFDFVSECVAVLLLVVLPLRMLWRVRLSKRQRRMILSAFASSVVLVFAAAFHILGRILQISVVTVTGVNVEVTLSLFLCNFLVVVTYAYRYWIHHMASTDTEELEDVSPSHDDDFTTPIVWTTTMHLTTVDLTMSL